jgi:molybdopterin-guanine dinucleotide biosynthesis protein A
MTRLATVILAGGRAERLGGLNKALIEVGGRRLIDRLAGALGDCKPILLATGANRFPDDIDIPARHRIPDLPSSYGGPLAGVAAAVDALRGTDAEILLSVAVDTPFFPADFATRALPLLAHSAAVIACYGAQDYPTNALWRLDALRGLPDEVLAGTAPHSLKRLGAGLGAAHLDYADLVPADPFSNVNTPEDLAALRARAGAG